MFQTVMGKMPKRELTSALRHTPTHLKRAERFHEATVQLYVTSLVNCYGKVNMQRWCPTPSLSEAVVIWSSKPAAFHLHGEENELSRKSSTKSWMEAHVRKCHSVGGMRYGASVWLLRVQRVGMRNIVSDDLKIHSTLHCCCQQSES